MQQPLPNCAGRHHVEVRHDAALFTLHKGQPYLAKEFTRSIIQVFDIRHGSIITVHEQQAGLEPVILWNKFWRSSIEHSFSRSHLLYTQILAIQSCKLRCHRCDIIIYFEVACAPLRCVLRRYYDKKVCVEALPVWQAACLSYDVWHNKDSCT